MSEDEAREWAATRFGPAAVDGLDRLAALVRAGAEQQNLVARSTLDTLWSRHIVDSAQLIDIAGPVPTGSEWLDIGSGAGFPGLVVALLTGQRTILVEPRRRRVKFLENAVEALSLKNTVTVVAGKVETVRSKAAIISARAVASLATLFDIAAPCAHPDTVWVLPKGKSAREEVATTRESWHGVFHVEHSITDPVSLIVRASGVKRR